MKHAPSPGVRELLGRQDDERRHLAGVLHDTVTDGLASLISHLDLIERTEPRLGARMRALVEDSRAIARQCFDDVRRVAERLAPPLVADVGLPLAVRCFVSAFVERRGIEVRVDEMPAGRRLAPAAEVAVFRLVEEWLDSLADTPPSRSASIAMKAAGGAMDVAFEPVRADLAQTWRARLRLQFGRAIKHSASPLDDRETAVRFAIKATLVGVTFAADTGRARP
jgi:signal transduction histidine kinase